MKNYRAGRRARLILADDHRMVVEGLRAILERQYDIAGVAFGAQELLALLDHRPAECLMLELLIAGGNGLDLIPRIRQLQPTLKILVVTVLIDRVLADAALAAGASGFIPKSGCCDELCIAISEVLAGRRYLSPQVPKTSHRVSLGAKHLGLHRLTPRQQEVVLLMGEGKSATEICKTLDLSQSTITFHKHNIMRVLGVGSDADLVRYSVLVRAGECQG